MKLLVFAHYGEAKEFIKNIPAIRARFDLHPQFYIAPDLALLITGEGMDRVFLSLGKVLAQLSEIEQVNNFGIAATLDEQLARDRIVGVRTVYRYLSSAMEFKSYSSSDEQANLDCVSSFQRIQNPREAKKLSHFGDLLDRELWAIGALCHFHHIPFRSFKLLSDRADGNASCQLIQSRTDEYSQRLFQQFERLPKDISQDHPLFPALPPGLYWTESLRRQFASLEKRWCVQYPETPIEQLCPHHIEHPKKKTLAWLQRIKERLSPINTQIKREIDQLLAPHSSNKVKIHYDPRLESSDLKMTINPLISR